MRIALVAPGGFDRSGTQRILPVFLWMAERLARSHQVHVFTLRHDTEPCAYRLRGAWVHAVGFRPGERGPGVLLRALRLIRQVGGGPGFDAVHGLWAGEPGLCAGLAGRLLRAPSVLTLAGGELAALPEIGYGGALRWTSRAAVRASLRMATAATAASEPLVRQAAQLRADVRLIPLGVDIRLFRPGSPPQGPPWHLIQVASLNRVKDQPTLLRAVALALAREPGIRLHCVGMDTLGGEIQRLAAGLGLADRAVFHGFQPTERVAALLADAHLYIQSSLHESGGIAVREAAACAVPVLGTSVGHLAEMAPRAAVGVPPGDPAALADAIVDLLRDEDARRGLAARGRNWAARHDADWTAAAFAALYADLRRSAREGVSRAHGPHSSSMTERRRPEQGEAAP